MTTTTMPHDHRYRPTLHLTEPELLRVTELTGDQLRNLRNRSLVRPSVRPDDGSTVRFRWGLADTLTVRILATFIHNDIRTSTVSLRGWHMTILRTLHHADGFWLDELPALYENIFVIGTRDGPHLCPAHHVAHAIRHAGTACPVVRIGGHLTGLFATQPAWND